MIGDEIFVDRLIFFRKVCSGYASQAVRCRYYDNKFVLKPYTRQCLFLINPEAI